MAKKLKKGSNKGITLIALVITIIILLILASISITSLTGENSIITNAKKAKFQTEVAEYKEILEIYGILYEKPKSVWDLKEKLEKQKKALEDGVINSEDAIATLGTLSGNISDQIDLLHRLEQLLVGIRGSTNETDKNNFKLEISELITEYDSIIESTEVNGIHPFKGELVSSKHFVLNFGYQDFEQGSLSITTKNLLWNHLHQTTEINYENIEQEIEKIYGMTLKWFNVNIDISSKINALYYSIEYSNHTISYLEDLLINIFGEKENLSEEEAIANAKSWNTSISLIQIIESCFTNISGMLQSINELTLLADNTNDKESIQKEINELIKEIQRELTYLEIGNRKLFDGSFPGIPQTTITTLGIQNISVQTNEQSQKASQATLNALNLISEFREKIGKKQNEMENKTTEQADNGYAFDVEKTIIIPTEIYEKYKNKFQIINGKLTYIGNDKDEKQWANEMGIHVL